MRKFLVEKEKTDFFWHSTSYSMEKTFTKTKSDVLKELLIHGNKLKTKRVCSWRCHLRNTGWWETVNSEYSDKRFKQTFRVSRKTFNFLLTKVEQEITKKETAETPVSASKRLPLCLYKLARGDYCYTISEKASIGESTVIKIAVDVYQIIVENMWHDSVEKYFPKSEEEFLVKMQDMERTRNAHLVTSVSHYLPLKRK